MSDEEAALGRHWPPKDKPDLALAYHWTTYARLRDREKARVVREFTHRMLKRL